MIGMTDKSEKDIRNLDTINNNENIGFQNVLVFRKNLRRIYII